MKESRTFACINFCFFSKIFVCPIMANVVVAFDYNQPKARMLQEAFAVVREASKRVLGLRPFDVQLIGKLLMYDFFFGLVLSMSN
jgi:hypothetical protein